MSVIPTLALKESFSKQYDLNIKKEKLPTLTECSRLLDEILNRKPNKNLPYVGASAFSHKGGLHVSAVQKDPKTYEHVDPCLLYTSPSPRDGLLSRMPSSA